MRVGLYYTMDSVDGRSMADVYAEAIEQIKLADDIGIDSVWVAERHFSDEEQSPALQMFLSTVAASTSAIRIGSGVKILPLDHPIRAAEDFSLIDLLSAGRVNFGVGEGHDLEEYRAHNIPWEDRWERFQEAVELVLRAWTNDTFTYNGEYYKFPSHTTVQPVEAKWAIEPYSGPYVPQWFRGMETPEFLAVTPKPMQEPHPPVYIGGWSRTAIEYAARKGFTFLFSPMETLTQLREKVGWYRSAQQQAGRDASETQIAVIREVCVRQDGAEARHLAEGPLMRLYQRHQREGLLSEAEGRAVSASDVTYDRLSHDRFLVGTPDEVVNKIKDFQASTGLNHLICHMQLPGLSHQEALNSINIFAREVQPMLQA